MLRSATCSPPSLRKRNTRGAYCLKKQGITRLAVLESISHNDEEGQDESSSESGEGEGGAESAKDALAVTPWT